jgi:hypothetical protein
MPGAARVACVLVLLASATLPFAGADDHLGVHPAETCAQQPVLTDEACMERMLLTTSASIYPTQVTLSCGSTCTYRPTSHVALEGVVTGEWRIDGSSQLRGVSGGRVGGVVSGSHRTLSCVAAGEGASCHQQIDHSTISAGNLNTFLWEGSWSVTFTDATGETHLMATGADSCYVAQYYNPPNDACEGN